MTCDGDRGSSPAVQISRQRQRQVVWWLLLSLVGALMLALSACSRALGSEPEASVGIMFVEVDDVDGEVAEQPVAQPLDGSIVRRDVKVFVETPVRGGPVVVSYHLNDPERETAPLHVTDERPFEFTIAVEDLAPGEYRLDAFAESPDLTTVFLPWTAFFTIEAPEGHDLGDEPGEPEPGEPGEPEPGEPEPGEPGEPEPGEPGEPEPGEPGEPEPGEPEPGEPEPGEPGEPEPGEPEPGEPEPPPPPADPPPPPVLPPSEYDHLEQLFVSVNGSDQANGSASAPLRTINEGIERAVRNRASNLGTRINVLPGVYRESIINTYRSAPAPTIVVQAVTPGTVTISGSDVWTDWNCSGGTCTRHWPYKWGTDPNPWAGARDIGELARRREMVVVNGRNLDQHMSLGALTTGSFYVDDANGRIHVRPPAGVDLNAAVVEVAVRPMLIRMQGMSDFVIKGLRFQHAASAFASSAVTIVDQRRVLIEDSIIEWNGQNGISFKGTDITVRNTVMSNNGSSGLQGYQVADILFEDTVGSYNNWRGDRVDYRGWNVGHKFGLAHRLTLRRHTSIGNLTNGFWFDHDGADILIEDSVFCNNTTSGLFVEAVQGPIVIRGSRFCDNGTAGITTSATHRLTLIDNVFENNAGRQIFIAGDFGRRVTNWETGASYVLNNENWTWRGNTMRATGSALLIGTTHSVSRFSSLMATSSLTNNTYEHSTSNVFQVGGGSTVSFADWQKTTGQDGSSVFRLR